MVSSDVSPLAKAVSAVFRARMGAKRRSGKWLAEQVGASQNYVAKRLRDEASFTLDDVAAISAALDLDPAGVLALAQSDMTQRSDEDFLGMAAYEASGPTDRERMEAQWGDDPA